MRYFFALMLFITGLFSQTPVELVARFEALQKEHNAVQLLALFTPPDPEEVPNYIFLAGTDIGGPRLFNNVSTSYRVLNFKVDEHHKPRPDFEYFIVTEWRSVYGGPSSPKWKTPKAEQFYIFIRKIQGIWKVDSYLSADGAIKIGKYGGFLMEYTEGHCVDH